jgi:hypothetical protein
MSALPRCRQLFRRRDIREVFDPFVIGAAAIWCVDAPEYQKSLCFNKRINPHPSSAVFLVIYFCSSGDSWESVVVTRHWEVHAVAVVILDLALISPSHGSSCSLSYLLLLAECGVREQLCLVSSGSASTMHARNR